MARFPQGRRDWWEWGWEVSFPGLCPAGQVTLDKTRVVEEPASLAPSLLSRGNKRAGVQERGRRDTLHEGPSWCGQAPGSRLLQYIGLEGLWASRLPTGRPQALADPQAQVGPSWQRLRPGLSLQLPCSLPLYHEGWAGVRARNSPPHCPWEKAQVQRKDYSWAQPEDLCPGKV